MEKSNLQQTSCVRQHPKRKRISSNNWQRITLCAIPVMLTFIFSYIPMFGLFLAFKRFNYAQGVFGSPWNGFDNFEYLFKSDTFYRITRNTLGMNFIFIIVGVVAACCLAILLYRLTSRKSTKVYQTILITPHFLSWVVVSYMVYAILHLDYGTMNNLLALMGINTVDWYGTPGAWPVILTICSVWKHVGMDSVIYYAALMGIDQSLFEAAEIDGASKRQITRYIMLPGIMSVVIMMVLLKVGGIFRADFGLFYQIPRNVGALYETTDVIDTYVFRTLREGTNLGVTSAVGLVQSVVGLITVLISNFVVKRFDSDSALF